MDVAFFVLLHAHVAFVLLKKEGLSVWEIAVRSRECCARVVDVEYYVSVCIVLFRACAACCVGLV